MTTEIIRENGIAEGAGAWPIFHAARELLVGRDLSVLTVRARTAQGFPLAEAARAAILELRRVIDSYAQERPLETVLFAAHETMQRNSPLVLRRDLWESIQGQYGLPGLARTFDQLVYRTETGHRKAGVAILSRAELAAAVPVLRKNHSAALLLSDHDKGLDSFPLPGLFDLAFGDVEPAGQVRWGHLVSGCLDLDLLPVRVVGEFDDREVDVDVFAGRSLIDALAEAAGS